MRLRTENAADSKPAGFSRTSFDLLGDLIANNHKTWFDAHRDEVRRHLRDPFQVLLEAATDRLAGSTMPLAGGKQTMFRMNRDVRFSNDKSPYKTAVSGMLTDSGKKNLSSGLTYLQLDSSGGFVAAGYYRLSPKALVPIRDTIVDHPDEFKSMLTALRQAKLQLSTDDSLSAMPRGYADHAEAHCAPWLKLQSFIVQRQLTKKAWTSGSVLDEVVAFTTAAAPLIHFGQTN